jgi:hypothetical protein
MELNIRVLMIVAGVFAYIPAVHAATINGKYYSDNVSLTCPLNPPCVVSFAQTPDTVATLKVQHLSCSLTGTSSSALTNATFEVSTSGGLVLAERFAAAGEIKTGAPITLNMSLAAPGVPLFVPKKGKLRLILDGGTGSGVVRCTIIGIYN